MRIAHFVSDFPVQSETFVVDEIKAAAEAGHQNIVVTLRPPGSPLPAPEELQQLGIVDVLRPYKGGWAAFRTGRKSILLPWWFLRRAVRQPREVPRLGWTYGRFRVVQRPLTALDVDHCHAHFAHFPALLARLCARALNVSFTWNAHSYDFFNYDCLRSSCVKAADVVFPVSQRIANWLQDRFPRYREKVDLIRCGLDLQTYSLAPPRELNSPPVVLGVGRLVDTKGFADLIQATALLAKQGLELEVRLIGDGPERQKLEQLCARLGLTRQVRFLGALPRDRVRSLQLEADFAVQPSCAGRDGLDGIPVVLMEAMALGVPVISTRFAGIPELISDSETGRLVDPHNHRQLAEAIQELLEDHPLRRLLRINARARIEAEYDGPANYAYKVERIAGLVRTRKDSA